ncbi:unnamed protein product [Eruca vesicaria subsp. sativa]|uniref:At2g29880-like C-terminal domain-containing protein n=1 Tax=Eruca vesicaria subsp. sativa TaxID=29727 RepID=A0ABC8JKU2_ERUVS|nr:unnamed protein product [Eruca vesicaria subsp. sativa]
MGDPQDVKSKGQDHSWSGPEHKLLLRSLVDAINHGFRDANADAEVWDVYLKANPGNKHMRDDSFEDFEELRMIFGQNTATGQNAMGLGDHVDTLGSQVEEGERENDLDSVQVMNDGEGIVHQQVYEHGVCSSAEKNRGDKLPLRKKARTDSNLDKALDEVTEVSSKIFGMIQQRWEKEAVEKEAEEKANNVWDAIKQIPDLDDDLRYEAMTLVHSLGMKSGFVNMSAADRCGWIKQNLRKP